MLKNQRGDCYSHYAVCRFLFDRLGLPSLLVSSEKNDDSDFAHYWNMVSQEGKETYYHFDSTPRQTGGDFSLVPDDYLDAYSVAHDECFSRDKSLYPPTP